MKSLMRHTLWSLGVLCCSTYATCGYDSFVCSGIWVGMMMGRRT